MRSLSVRYSPRARSDLSDIHDWLADRSGTAATAVIAAIRDTTNLIGEYPMIGRQTDIPGVRVLPVARYPYLVYYVVELEGVAIIHVRHGARDTPPPGDV